MPTKLFLRNTQDNGIGSTYYDMLVGAGAAADTAVVDTVASGTEIQWTKTAGGAIAQWISGRAPAGGFTLTSTDISIWARESNMNANCGGRFRVFKRAADATETELGGGPFNDGVEFTTADAEYLWIGNVTDTVFAENDRILLKVYITNVGTMGGGFTCTLTFNGADAATGDSFFNIAETVTFKTEDRRAQVSWSEIEVPSPPRRAQVSWSELEVPTAPRRAQVSWSEIEVPTAPRRAQVSWSEIEIPSAPRRAQISWSEFEVPNVPAAGGVKDYIWYRRRRK